jgi:hypothetical protein
VLSGRETLGETVAGGGVGGDKPSPYVSMPWKEGIQEKDVDKADVATSFFYAAIQKEGLVTTPTTARFTSICCLERLTAATT